MQDTLVLRDTSLSKLSTAGGSAPEPPATGPQHS